MKLGLFVLICLHLNLLDDLHEPIRRRDQPCGCRYLLGSLPGYPLTHTERTNAYFSIVFLFLHLAFSNPRRPNMQFGDFSTLCSQVPSYTWCNLFYRQVSSIFNRANLINVIDHLNQVLHNDAALLTGLSADPATAPVGVNPECGIPLVQANGSLGNIANIIACGLSVIVVVALIVFASRRKAAVGKFSMLDSFLRKNSPVYPRGLFVSSRFHLSATHMACFYRAHRAPYILWRIPFDTDIPNSDDWLRHPARHPRPGHPHCHSCWLSCYSFLDLAWQCHRGDTDRRRWHFKLHDSAFLSFPTQFQSLT